jgi:hypothetical protein
MKKLLISLFTLFSFVASAQITDTVIVYVPFQKVSLSNYYTKADVLDLTDSISNVKVDKATTINGKALSSNITLTKSDFSDLNNVDNTSDLNKPISTATQSALDLKLNISTAASTYEPKISVKNTAFNKNFGITAGTVADGKMVIDSLTALSGRKVDTSYRDNVGLIYPQRYDSVNNNMYLSQSWLDSLAAKAKVWPINGDSTTTSLNKFLGYVTADSLRFKVKNGFSGIIDATNHNTGLGYLGFTNSGANLASGSFNTWLGYGAGGGNSTTSDGVFIGSSSKVTIDNSHYVIAIGSDATATKSYQTVIGTPNTTETKLYGTILGGSAGTDTLVKKSDLKTYATFTDLKNVSGALSTRNYSNDSIAFVDGHLNQWDLYRTGNSVKILTTLPYDTTMFGFIVDNRDGNSANMKLRLTTYAASLSATVYWGDGDSTVMTGDSAIYHPIHTYASSGYYIGKIRLPVITDLRELYLNDDATNTIKIAGINGLNKLTNLNVLYATRSSLTDTVVSAIKYPASLVTLSFSDNKLTTYNPTYIPSGLTTLILQSNEIPSSTAIYLPPTLTNLNIRTQAVGGNTWVSSDVNTMLQYIDSKPFNAGAKTLDIRQFNSAPPTGAGLTAKTNLTSEGWTVTTD